MMSIASRSIRTLAIAVSLSFATEAALAQAKAVPAHGIDPALGHDRPLEALALHSDLEDFVEAVKAAGLAESLTDGTHYTIFAPTNKALDDENLDVLLRPENRDALVALLHAHIVSDDVDWEAARKAGSATTIDGGTVSIAVDGDRLRIADTTTVDSSVVVGKLRVYPIDTVLPGSAPLPLARFGFEYPESR